MRMPFCGALVVVATLGTFSQVGSTQVTAATNQNDGRGPKTLVGAWFFDVHPTLVPAFVSLGTFHSDGTLTNISSVSLDSPPESPAYGAWVRVGGHTFLITFWTIFSDGDGNFTGTSRVRATVTIGPSGEASNGVFQVDFFDASGTLIVSDTGTVQGRRIKVEPLP
jgi:hypothetical protein